MYAGEQQPSWSTASGSLNACVGIMAFISTYAFAGYSDTSVLAEGGHCIPFYLAGDGTWTGGAKPSTPRSKQPLIPASCPPYHRHSPRTRRHLSSWPSGEVGLRSKYPLTCRSHLPHLGLKYASSAPICLTSTCIGDHRHPATRPAAGAGTAIRCVPGSWRLQDTAGALLAARPWLSCNGFPSALLRLN